MFTSPVAKQQRRRDAAVKMLWEARAVMHCCPPAIIGTCFDCLRQIKYPTQHRATYLALILLGVSARQALCAPTSGAAPKNREKKNNTVHDDEKNGEERKSLLLSLSQRRKWWDGGGEGALWQ